MMHHFALPSLYLTFSLSQSSAHYRLMHAMSTYNGFFVANVFAAMVPTSTEVDECQPADQQHIEAIMSICYIIITTAFNNKETRMYGSSLRKTF